MNKNHLLFGVLILALIAVLLIGFTDQVEQNNRKEATKSLVEDAINLITLKGEGAYSEFRQSGTKWFQGDTYVFVWRTDGLRIVYPPDAGGEGQNMTTLVDATGKPIGKLFIDVALSEKGEGWIDYMWPKPQETEPSLKQTYIKGIQSGQEMLLVGSGFYTQTSVNTLVPLQYVAIVLEGVIAGLGLLIVVRQKRPYGYGILLTFAIYVVYDLARLTSEISDVILYPIFFIATASMLWAVILLYKERKS
jgi:hypothetical protein